MFPDPDWRAEDQPRVQEDQPRVQARTSGGNKDKDIDDDQGGDIYLLGMFEKKSNHVRRVLRRITSEEQF